MLTKFHLKTIIILWLIISGNSINQLFAQGQISIGAAISPLHQSVQQDFSADRMPYDAFVGIQRGPLGIRANYNWNGTYLKEGFSYTTTCIELSFLYFNDRLFENLGLTTYARAGVSRWQTDFTTQGYPGITEYELKVERDSGFGPHAALGILYPIKTFEVGIEAEYARNGTGQFIAGGFDPQPLQTGQMMLKVIAQYNIPINTFSKRGFSAQCPKF